MCSFHTGLWQQSYPCRVSSLLRACALFILLLAANSQPTAAQDKLLPVFQFNRLTTADGLPSSEIRSNVGRDRTGFVWVGLENGLARYDGYTCKVYREFSTPNNALKLFIDSQGRLWVGKYATGLSLYDPVKDRFVNFLKAKEDSASLHASYIAGIFEDDAGILWFGTEDDIVSVDPGMSTNTDSVVQHIRFRTTPFKGFKDGATQVERWDDNSMLVVSFGGLFVVNRHTRSISRAPLPRMDGMRLATLSVFTVFRESPQKLWLGTASHGLVLLDQDKRTLTSYHKNRKNASGSADDQIHELQLDNHGRMWITTGNGLDVFDVRSGSYMDYLTSWGGPGKSMFTRMSIDSTGILWISTADDGLYFLSPASFRFPHYAVRGAAGAPMEMETTIPWSDGTYWITAEGKLLQIRLDNLSVLRSVDLFKREKSGFGQAVYASLDDGKGTLWFGTWGLGLYSYEPRSGRVKNFHYAHRLPGLVFNSDVCKGLVKATGDTLWVAGYDDKLLAFDTRRQTFTSIPHDPRGQVWDLMKDRSGRIWISDQLLGLFVADPSSRRSELLRSDSTDSGSMSDIHPYKTYEDLRGRIWVGGKVLRLWDPESRSFKSFVNNDPVLADPILSLPLRCDSKERLWVHYPGKGMGLLSPQTNTFTDFDGSDGLISPMSMTSLPDGRVMLVGSRGMNLVHPDSLFAPGRAPPLVISKITVNDSANVHYQSYPTTPARLGYDQHVLEFEFAAIDPGQGHLITYRYRLEGFEESWIDPGQRRYVRYPGLAPGSYVFRVKATSTFGRWPEQETALAFSIAPPWWRTIWAYGFYALLALAALWAAYSIRFRQVQLRQMAEMEHLQAEHLAEVDRLRSRFFANISHEFRTPLTLILGPLHKWKEREPETIELRKDLAMVERNARRLLRLINQLLELSKLEAGAITLRACRTNIVPLVRGIAYSFETSAGSRRIGLEVVTPEDAIEVYCDRDMVEKILTNLIANAFKFTPDGGSVVITLTPSPSPKMGEGDRGGEGSSRMDNGFVEISVSDTGIGIPPEQLTRIFDRFFQVDASHTREHEGSGVGLALVKELVELHHGTIEVTSEVGRGTEFIVRLPMGRAHLHDEEIVDAPALAEPPRHPGSAIIDEIENGESVAVEEPLPAGDQRPIILIVEDNTDVREYVKSFLLSAYRVLEARDGAEGEEKALEAIPDLVISDIMMPAMDGYEFCKRLKLNERTSHIPVILLTAKAASEDRVEGLETGADDYLVKPFEPKELLARVKNLIVLRRRLRERFSAGQILKPGEITVSSIDDTFLQKVKTIVESHLSEEGFGVEDLSGAVGMSRSQIHRKLTALTGLATGDFIRYLRLHRAMDLLQQNAATISEIAYSVGFSTPAHFSKCFHEQFGRTPSEVRKPAH
jgi:signal transduction histidine kinase/DNA-binding response OmpR family regulator/ligand-binding sensor domain-containing protein